MSMERLGAFGKKITGVVVIVLCLAGGFYVWQRYEAGMHAKTQRREMPPAVVTAHTVEQKTVSMPLEYVGQTVGYKQVELRARVGGILTRKVYKEGQRIKAGELMFVIDPEPYRAALDRQRAELDNAKVQRDRARIERDRVVALYARQAVSEAERDDAVTAYNSSVAAVSMATALVREAQINLNWTQVRAPISGITGQEARSEGNLVTLDASGSLLTTIVQSDPLYVEFAVPADEYRRNEKLRTRGTMKSANGKSGVEILLSDGTVFPVRGFINFRDQVADPQTGAIRMRAELSNPEGRLLPGQFVRVKVLGNELRNVILVPQRSVMMTQDGAVVYRLSAQDMPETCSVDIVLSVGNSYLIDKGIQPGDRIVLDGTVKVRPGVPVHVAGQERAPHGVSSDQASGS